MKSWVVSANPKYFDVDRAFRELECIDWRQNANFEVGDIVYIYVGREIGAIKYKCRVKKINLQEQEIDDRRFWLNNFQDNSKGNKKYMELTLLKMLDTPLLNLSSLKPYGFFAPQGATILKEEIKNYIEDVEINMDKSKFSWIEFYMAFASRLLEFKDNRGELAERIKSCYHKITEKHSDFSLTFPQIYDNSQFKELDPFTIFGLFNKTATDQNRNYIIEAFSEEFNIGAEANLKFEGIPVLNPQKVIFAWQEQEQDNMWDMLEGAISYAKDKTTENREKFIKGYDTAIKQKGVLWNITMGLFWIRPYNFINLDAVNRSYLVEAEILPKEMAEKIKDYGKIPNGREYLEICDYVLGEIKNKRLKYKDFAELSYSAWENKKSMESDNNDIDNYINNKYIITITKSEINSTDKSFSMEEIFDGDRFEPVDAYFENSKGEIIRRVRDKGERKVSNQVLPRIALQIYEDEILALPKEERLNFPICQYTPDHDIIRGIFSSTEEFKQYKNTIEYLVYNCKNKEQLVVYCWNVFSTLLFVKECLARFGQAGDKFILVYTEKVNKNNEQEEKNQENKISTPISYQNPYSKKLLNSKNIIFRGAPGTGKSYLAYQIASDIVSKGKTQNYMELSDDEKERIGFVQFHPSYDYTDFVEGLRPTESKNGSASFELRDGVFKSFVHKAKSNLENSKKQLVDVIKERTTNQMIEDFFDKVELGRDEFKTINGTKFYITDIDDQNISISIPQNAIVNTLKLSINEIRQMLDSNESFERIKDIAKFLNKKYATQGYSYEFVLYNEIRKTERKAINKEIAVEEEKSYVFIIDEINRGEISKIFGELFFSIDPSYRGERGAVLTQYSNLHENSEEKFFIPENVYIIGTMNDIDRSVDTFDFAMRRRFRFIEIKAGDSEKIIDSLDHSLDSIKASAKAKMEALNSQIAKIDELGENYQIGGAYFLKLEKISFNELWEDYLEPLLLDYTEGMYNQGEIMESFKRAYDSENIAEVSQNE